ncbi:chemotaxis signal transduction protein CheW [Clostridium aceticum]|uniref:Chemotaxis protein CheW n=1 Tax=Clostridium aceticum TaxID=84022 RepID=A0A0G3WC33_9CLOT|nr:chemotaxis protein CheW [Clostridium aceticum]AKL95457.1 chemotaxis signal transduction protein CheW [Clostridium aceticum]
MDNHIDTINQYVVFQLDEEYYGIAINLVETIEKVLEITRLPNAPYYVKGVINLRGEVIPVVDLRKRFKMEEKSVTEESRIIILSLDEMIVGILVDSSSEVITIEKEDIENTNNIVNAFEDDYIKGIGKVEGRIIIILDMLKILSQEVQEA